ncbi:hypothetical protein [Szabonella alba]|uniref:Uncharacterized protein n=1 Tax=Szabonella alba TaxID=2804194 RepID=A0A8K0Y090_9RHOB|nr:hypothetical protein [Szabonella alba]MBL4917596.1 hypothetical protein [Szabonella alba]
MRITINARMPERRHPLDGVIRPRVTGCDPDRDRQTMIRDEVTGDFVIIVVPPDLKPEPTPEPELPSEADAPEKGAEGQSWQPGPVDPLPGDDPVQDDAGEGDIVLIEPLAEAAPDAAGANGDASAQPAEAPAGASEARPGGEPDAEAPAKSARWTDEEDTRAVVLVTNGVMNGQTKAAAIPMPAIWICSPPISAFP